MAKEAFISKKFSQGSLDIIAHANVIIADYQAQGFQLTLRQLYYQFVSRDLLPNKQKEYKRLGSIINDGRLAGLIDWSAIEDRTRNVETVSTWSSPSSILDVCADQYKENLWEDQRIVPEVWIEKDALVGVIDGVCSEWRVPYFACRGYTSQSEQYAAGKRFAALRREGKTPIVFHLGDHDPSGIDMTRDNGDRLSMFARHGVEVRRLALNMTQVEEYDPPPNPAKETDSRAQGYIDLYGASSWELDALSPAVIAGLIRDAITGVVDMAAWSEGREREEEQRDKLQRLSERWEELKI